MQQKPTTEILERYLEGRASAKERQLVEQWYEAADEGEGVSGGAVGDDVKEQLYEKVRSALGLRPRVVRMAGRWRLGVAAAAVLAVVGLAMWLWPADRTASGPMVQAPAEHPSVPEVLPGGDKATLTLADGSVIVLDSTGSGALTRQGGVQVIKLDDGRLRYDAAPTKDIDGPSLYNTITTPMGGQYQLILPDGSAVWLNAGSSLRFPVAFQGPERKVELSGEGYFEVRRDAARPFRVEAAGGLEVAVLGTSFNVNVYDNEPVQTVTVVSGKVAVQGPDASPEMLTRGQQAQSTGGQLVRREGVDLEPVVAWKNGLFQFDSEDIASLMRQVARWYDVEVQFPKGVPKGRITGKVRRDMDLAQVLKVLELSGVRCAVEGRTIVVLP